MKLLVVDDHPLIRRGVRQILEEAYPEVTVVEADDGETAMDLIRRETWNLVILDLSMPGMSGLEVLEHAGRHRPGLKALVLSMHSEQELALQALRLGAAGYITKDHASEELLAAIARIMGGGRYLGPQVAEALANRLSGESDAPPHTRLSAREFRVMCLLAQGRSPTEIAEQLAISIKTVSTYRARLLEKMDMTSNADLTRYCLANRLID